MAIVDKSSTLTLTVELTLTDFISTHASLTLFQGTLNSWGMREGQLRIEVSSILSRWNQQTLSKHSGSCRWKKFKGDECVYVGAATWCDRTYARCETLGNELNFGGFRWLPSIVGKEVWWGRIPTTE